MANEESATLQNILAAGKEEFLEKGFKSASLRNIVKTAGVTTGAFYGYFSGKEALFAALVEEHATAIMNIFMSAQEDFEMLDEKDKANHMGVESRKSIDAILDYVYEHFDEFKLIICKSEPSVPTMATKLNVFPVSSMIATTPTKTNGMQQKIMSGLR